MIIKDLQRNKKNRNFIPYLRKVVESYRAGLVSSTELKTGLQMDFKRVRHLNRWYFKYRILPLLKPKKTKKMKSDNARIKELEAKIKLLEKEKEFFKLKAVAWETLVDVAEETGAVLTDAYFHQKKVRTQTVEKLTCRYPLLGMSLLCSLFGFSRQAWYAAIKQKEKVSFEFDAVLAEILAIRKRIPGIGTAKLYELLKPFLSSHFIKMGRDKIHYLLKKEGLLVKKKGRRVGTTNSDHCLKKYPNLVKDIIPTETESLWVSEMTGTPSFISRVVVALLIYH